MAARRPALVAQGSAYVVFPGERQVYAALGCAAAEEDGGDGAEQDLQIERGRPVVDVLQIELHPAIEVDVVAAADLPETRQSGLHRQAAAMPPLIRADFLRNRRTRADETHVAFEDVPELRQLIERELPEETSDGGDARIVFRFEDGPGHLVEVTDFAATLVRVGDHRPELAQRDDAAVQGDALLPEAHAP